MTSENKVSAEQTRLRIVHLELDEANEIVARLHRHHKPAVGHRFSIGIADEVGEIRGAVIVGRPVARAIDQHSVVEVARLVTDGCPNACSALYQAAARAAKALGYARIQTYILESEPGTSLKAAGWVQDGAVTARSWSVPSRPRRPHVVAAKKRYVRELVA